MPQERVLAKDSLSSPTASILHPQLTYVVSVAVRNDYGLLRIAAEEVHNDSSSAVSNAVVLTLNDVPQLIGVVAQQEVNEDVEVRQGSTPKLRRSGLASSSLTVSSTDEDSVTAGSNINVLSPQKEKKSGLTVSSAITISSRIHSPFSSLCLTLVLQLSNLDASSFLDRDT
eukprot:scaffold30111_cov43-Cyclotella_meneghiniana.AAC.3